jgi:hypothetical protein
MVFAEGAKTEPIYLTHWYRAYRDRVIVKIAKHEETSPFELVERAVAQRSSDLREERRGRGDAFEEYWCIFDVDEHPKIPEALQLAQSNSINVALSGPNIELWFLVHFEAQTAYIRRDETKRRAYALLDSAEALSLRALGLLTERYSTAKDRAQSLDRKHEGDGTAKPWNPSSDVWKLIDAIRGD